ncbi:hypothetical protein AC229_1714 [Oenococcus oeni]|nr:hypothetical protein AC229_1714 [Oenococcus oeni]
MRALNIVKINFIVLFTNVVILMIFSIFQNINIKYLESEKSR